MKLDLKSNSNQIDFRLTILKQLAQRLTQNPSDECINMFITNIASLMKSTTANPSLRDSTLLEIQNISKSMPREFVLKISELSTTKNLSVDKKGYKSKSTSGGSKSDSSAEKTNQTISKLENIIENLTESLFHDYLYPLLSTMHTLTKTISTLPNNSIRTTLMEKIIKIIKPISGESGEQLLRHIIDFQLLKNTAISLSSFIDVWKKVERAINQAIIASRSLLAPRLEKYLLGLLVEMLVSDIAIHLKHYIIPDNFIKQPEQHEDTFPFKLATVLSYHFTLNRYVQYRGLEDYCSFNQETVEIIKNLNDMEDQKEEKALLIPHALLFMLDKLYAKNPEAYYSQLANALLQYKISITYYGFVSTEEANNVIGKYQDLYNAIDVGLDTHDLTGDTDFNLGGHTVSKKDLYACFAGLPDRTLFNFFSDPYDLTDSQKEAPKKPELANSSTLTETSSSSNEPTNTATTIAGVAIKSRASSQLSILHKKASSHSQQKDAQNTTTTTQP